MFPSAFRRSPPIFSPLPPRLYAPKRRIFRRRSPYPRRFRRLYRFAAYRSPRRLYAIYAAYAISAPKRICRRTARNGSPYAPPYPHTPPYAPRRNGYAAGRRNAGTPETVRRMSDAPQYMPSRYAAFFAAEPDTPPQYAAPVRRFFRRRRTRHISAVRRFFRRAEPYAPQCAACTGTPRHIRRTGSPPYAPPLYRPVRTRHYTGLYRYAIRRRTPLCRHIMRLYRHAIPDAPYMPPVRTCTPLCAACTGAYPHTVRHCRHAIRTNAKRFAVRRHTPPYAAAEKHTVRHCITRRHTGRAAIPYRTVRRPETPYRTRRACTPPPPPKSIRHYCRLYAAVRRPPYAPVYNAAGRAETPYNGVQARHTPPPRHNTDAPPVCRIMPPDGEKLISVIAGSLFISDIA